MHGSEVWQKVSGAVKLDARFDRLESLEHLFSSAGTRLEEGAGKATIRAAIERGIAKGEVRLAVHDGSVRLEKLALRGDADVRLLIPAWNLMTGPLEISGSRVALSDVRASGSDDSRRWWGRFDIPSGKIDSTTTARIDAETRDARPLLALLAADLPAWTRGLVNLDDFSATGTVSLGPSLTRVERLDARGGSYHIQGRYLRDKATRDGAFLIESGALSVGIELQPDATKLRLLGAKKWYEEQRDARSDGPHAARDDRREAGRVIPTEAGDPLARHSGRRGRASPDAAPSAFRQDCRIRPRRGPGVVVGICDSVWFPIPSDGPTPQDNRVPAAGLGEESGVWTMATESRQSKCASCKRPMDADARPDGVTACVSCAALASVPSVRPRAGTILRHWTTNVLAFKGKTTATRSEMADWGLADARSRNLIASRLKSLVGAVGAL